VRTTAPTTSGGATIEVDLEAIRAALIGPSPVPAGWEAEIDELIVAIEAALANYRLPDTAGLDREAASCATWTPLVGRQSWAAGALLERQIFVGHLAQLASAAPDEIRSASLIALRVSSAAAAEQLKPDGNREVLRQVPRDELLEIGLWALEH
jgi:hypothetical protein